MQEKDTFGSNESFDEFRMLSKTIPWAAVIRSYMETIGRGMELKAREDSDESKVKQGFNHYKTSNITYLGCQRYHEECHKCEK